MNIIIEIEGRRFSVSATELLPTVTGETPKKETVQDRAAAAKTCAAVGAAGPGPEKAEIPAEPAQAASAPAAAAPKATPTGRKRGQTVTNPATAQAPQAASTAASAPVAASAAPAAPAASAAAPSVAAASTATKGDVPTPAQLDEYRAKFMILVKQLTDAGAVKKGDIPVATQLRNIMLKFNKATDVAALTSAQWAAFFDRVNTQYVNGEAGIKGLVAKL